MTKEKKEQLIRHLKYNLEIGADYLITDEDAVEIIKALEQQPSDDSVFKNLWAQVKWERDVAIEQLEQLGYSLGEKIRTSEDCISRQAVKDMLTAEWTKYMPMELDMNLSFVLDKISALPSVTPKTGWIPVKWHEITDEERVIEEYPNEWLVYLDCQMPDDGERILVQTKWGIELDECYIDDGCYLDSGYDWVDDIVAWMPLPQPYKEESEE